MNYLDRRLFEFDFEILEEGERAEVRVGDAIVVLTATQEGLGITVYPSDLNRDSVTETWATWTELKPEEGGP